MNDLDKERQTEGRKAWYAVQTFYCKEEHLGKFLEENQSSGNIWKKKG